MIYKINIKTANKEHEYTAYDEYYTPETAQRGFNAVMKTAKANGFKEVDRHKYHNNKTFYDEYTLVSDSERMEICYYSATRTA